MRQSCQNPSGALAPVRAPAVPSPLGLAGRQAAACLRLAAWSDLFAVPWRPNPTRPSEPCSAGSFCCRGFPAQAVDRVVSKFQLEIVPQFGSA